MTIFKRTWTHDGAEKEAFRAIYYVDGKKKFKQMAKRKDLVEWLKNHGVQIQDEAEREASPAGYKTVADAAQDWIDRCEKGLGDHHTLEHSSLEQYRGHVANHISRRIGSKLLTDVDTKFCKNFRDDLLKDLSRSQAKKVLTSFKSILNEMVDLEILANNPAQKVIIKIDKREKEEVQIPEPSEMKKILEGALALRDGKNKHMGKAWSRYYPMFLLATLTGLRPSEYRGLIWENLDLEAKTLKVTQRADNYNVIGLPKSRAGYRTLFMPQILVDELKRWQKLCPVGELGLVFPNWEGKVENLSNIHNRGWNPLLGRVGVTVIEDGKAVAKYHPYAMRHFRASVLIQAGANAKRVQMQMGHGSITMTYDTYGHLFKEGEAEDRALTETIADSLMA